MDLTDNQARLRDALPDPACPGAAPAALSDTTGLAYSTVTRLLRELRDLGVAARDDDAGTWHTTTTTGDDATAQAGAAHQPPAPGHDVNDPPAAPDPDTEVPEPVGSDDVHDAAATDDEAVHPRATAADPAADTNPERPATGKTRLGKGELRDMVLATLVNAGAPLGPTELSRLLDGRSSGAITNACDRLAGAGLIVQTSEHPRRWAAVGTPAAAEAAD